MSLGWPFSGFLLCERVFTCVLVVVTVSAEFSNVTIMETTHHRSRDNRIRNESRVVVLKV